MIEVAAAKNRGHHRIGLIADRNQAKEIVALPGPDFQVVATEVRAERGLDREERARMGSDRRLVRQDVGQQRILDAMQGQRGGLLAGVRNQVRRRLGLVKAEETPGVGKSGGLLAARVSPGQVDEDQKVADQESDRIGLIENRGLSPVVRKDAVAFAHPAANLGETKP